MIYTSKLNFVLLLSHFLVNISTTNISKVVSMLFSQRRRTYVDSIFLFNQISTLKQHWIINIESTQFFQGCFNVVLSTLKQRRETSVGSTFIFNQISMLKQRWFIDVEST